MANEAEDEERTPRPPRGPLRRIDYSAMPQAEPHASLADPQLRQAALAHVFAPWVRELVQVLLAGDALAAHATTTYALL